MKSVPCLLERTWIHTAPFNTANTNMYFKCKVCGESKYDSMGIYNAAYIGCWLCHNFMNSSHSQSLVTTGSTSHAFMCWTKSIRSPSRNLTSSTRCRTVCPSRPTTAGTSTTCWRRCGTTSSLCACKSGSFSHDKGKNLNEAEQGVNVKFKSSNLQNLTEIMCSFAATLNPKASFLIIHPLLCCLTNGLLSRISAWRFTKTSSKNWSSEYCKLA